MWSDIGFLKYLGARDAAGSGAVHLVGGFSGWLCSDKNISFYYIQHELFSLGLVGAIMLKPRTGFKGQNARITMGNAKMSLAGLFMIWWGTQAFNSGRYVAARIIHIPKNIHNI